MAGVPSAFSINGIHHLTAVSGNAPRTVDFYTGFLGLRLIKQTVNFDDLSSYHLYFAGEENGPVIGCEASVPGEPPATSRTTCPPPLLAA